MARQSTVVARIMPVLMAYKEQGRQLPATNQGKINVAGLCAELYSMDSTRIKEKANDAQHFHTKEELKDLVNEMAIAQGLLPISHNVPAPIEEAAVLEQRVQQAKKQASEDARSAVEATAAHDALLQELTTVRAELEATKLKLNAASERLRHIEEGGFLFPSLELRP